MRTVIPSLRMERVATQKVNNSGIQNFSLEVLPGEVYGIVSTQSFLLENLLSVFTGDVPIVQGSVQYMGKPVTMQQMQKTSNIMSIITRRDYLYSSFSAFDNIFFFDASYVHGKRGDCHKRCVEFLNRYQVKLDLNRKVTELTREERKMIEIMRAYLSGSKLIVMYETITRVSDAFAAHFGQVLEDMKKQGTSIIYLSTQLSDVLTVSNRISIFNDGQIKATMTQAEAKRNPQRVISILSGGEPVAVGDGQRADELSAIISAARDIMSSHRDMRKVLQFLASSLRDIKKAKSCTIYVIDERDNLMFSSDEADVVYTKLRSEAAYELANRFGEGPHQYLRGDAGFHELFLNTQGVEQIVCYPMFVRYDIKALIGLAFDRITEVEEKDGQLISTFCREVKISIESSLILEHSSLLQESHHRIKNNLQSIISLIYMQKSKLQDADMISKEMFNASLNSIVGRIKSIATIHDLLSKDRFGWRNIDMAWLTREIVQFYDRLGISFELCMDEIYIPYNKATSFALLINELVSNSTKHAFTEVTGKKSIRITCRKEDDHLYLCVADNGTGFDGDFDLERNSSIGMDIVRSIAQELSAELKFSNRGGMVVELWLPNEIVYRI